MNQSEAQQKYKELRAKLKVAERPWPVGMAIGLERLRLQNNINSFRQECLDEGITLLEPCPFCGSYEVYIHDPKYDEYDMGKYVECNRCDTHGPLDPKEESIAIAAWNKRVN